MRLSAFAPNLWSGVIMGVAGVDLVADDIVDDKIEGAADDATDDCPVD